MLNIFSQKRPVSDKFRFTKVIFEDLVFHRMTAQGPIKRPLRVLFRIVTNLKKKYLQEAKRKAFVFSMLD